MYLDVNRVTTDRLDRVIRKQRSLKSTANAQVEDDDSVVEKFGWRSSMMEESEVGKRTG